MWLGSKFQVYFLPVTYVRIWTIVCRDVLPLSEVKMTIYVCFGSSNTMCSIEQKNTLTCQNAVLMFSECFI